MAGEGGSSTSLRRTRKPAVGVPPESENRGGNSKETSDKFNHDRSATVGRGVRLTGSNLTGEQTRKEDHDGGGTGTNNKHKDKATASLSLRRVAGNHRGKEEKSDHDGSGTGTGKHTHQPVAAGGAALASTSRTGETLRKQDYHGSVTAGTNSHRDQSSAEVKSATLTDGNPMAKEVQKRDHNGRGTGQSASGRPSLRKT